MKVELCSPRTLSTTSLCFCIKLIFPIFNFLITRLILFQNSEFVTVTIRTRV